MNTTVLKRNKTQKVVLDVDKNKYPFFIELIRNFDFVQIEDNQGDSKEEIIVNLMEGFKQIKQIKKGQLQTRPVEELLNEF
ncbi:hypothetical protein AGMMS50262_19430 [Bacteroidia bacterium]|nr:hypothetical protein AGMMS50262_19430 [Bacteroidia bacterium]